METSKAKRPFINYFIGPDSFGSWKKYYRWVEKDLPSIYCKAYEINRKFKYFKICFDNICDDGMIVSVDENKLFDLGLNYENEKVKKEIKKVNELMSTLLDTIKQDMDKYIKRRN